MKKLVTTAKTAPADKANNFDFDNDMIYYYLNIINLICISHLKNQTACHLTYIHDLSPFFLF